MFSSSGVLRRGAPRLLVGVAAAVLLAPACSGPGAAPSGPRIDVTLKDFRIDSATASVAAGDVGFRIHNDAPATHEFVVVRTDLPAGGLPIATDGLSVDEDTLEPIGELGEVDAGTIGSLSLHLTPGRYVFFCNLEGHYLGGMHAVLEVT
jgi:uncharacterized cupredoxin-like copper-binding protein